MSDNRMSKLEKKLRCYIAVLIMYFTSTFGTLFMLFPYLPILFINKRLFHTLSDFSLHAWFGLTVFLMEKFLKIKIFLHQSKKDKEKVFQKGAIILMNHRTRLDWMFYFCILYRQNALSNIKIILKNGLKKIPGPGWAMQTAMFIFINRKWEIDRKIFTEFIDYFTKINKKVYILIFPEGTNLTEETKLKSDKFAQDNNLEEYKQVLHPRVTGFIHVYNEMNRNKIIDCIHDVTVAYKGSKIPVNELDFMNGNVPNEIHFYLDKFNTNDLFDHNNNSKQGLNETNLLENWLNDRWKIKETFLNHFYEEKLENFQSTYETETTTTTNGEENTKLLFIYPIYWCISCLIMFYLIYSFILVKIYFALAFCFYFFLQIFGNDLDNLILKLNNNNNNKRFTDEASFTTANHHYEQNQKKD